MKISIALIIAFFSVAVFAADTKMKMYYQNEDITKVIESYSKASGQKFVVDQSVRGKISIFIQEPVTLEEAFNQLSTSLALNGYAIRKQGDTMVVRSARNVQRDLIEVSTERPVLKPERMYTWVYVARSVPATSISNELRILTSKDGEMSVLSSRNQLIFTDWVSNLNRIAELLKEIDKAPDASVAKLVEAGRKEYPDRKKEAKKGPPAPPPEINQ